MTRPSGLDEALRARSAHLATVRPDGRPHVVVVTFAVANGEIVTAVDQKPKSTRRLQRLANIAHQPAVSLLVDHYEEDWDRLWWVRVDGRASLHEEGAVRDRAVAALAAKYPQYREEPPEGAAISIEMESVSFWASTP